MNPTPFWIEDAPRPQHLAGDPLPPASDVVVVGAGITGLNAARRLRAAGVEVTVVDAGPVGAGASTVNGGQVNYGLKAATSTLFARYGKELGLAFWQASLASIDLVEQVVKEEAIDCAFIRPGAAELGHNERDLRNFHEEAAWMAANLGFSVDVVGPERITEVIASPHFHCAMVDGVGASLHPARYVWGLAAAAGAAGASIVEHAGVTGVARAGAGYRLTTTRGPIDTATVLFATNGYTGPVVPELRRGVIPVGSYMVATAPLHPEQAEQLIPGNRAFWTARRFLNYFRRSPDDRILMGGRNNLRTDLDLAASATSLGATVRRIFPDLAEVPVTHSWTGRLAVTFDLMPHIGQVDGMWYAMGYGGHGVGIATYLGNEVGALIAGELDDSPFRRIEHPKKWYYRRRPWFLPLAAAWYRFLDRLGR